MKKTLSFLLALLVLFALSSCDLLHIKDEIPDAPYYFYAQVLEINENEALVKVTKVGSSFFYLGEQLVINTDVIGADSFSVDDVIIVGFDGKTTMSYPPKLPTVSDINLAN